MRVDATILEQLEARGLTVEHLELLLQLLSVDRNGSCSWHYMNGRLTQCDLRLTVPGKAPELREVRQVLKPYVGSEG